jgi:hypothetical protein
VGERVHDGPGPLIAAAVVAMAVTVFAALLVLRVDLRHQVEVPAPAVVVFTPATYAPPPG